MPPPECVAEKLIAFNAKYNMTALKTEIMKDAGVTEEMLGLALGPEKLFRGRVERAKAFTASEPVRSLRHSVRNMFSEPAKELLEMQGECYGAKNATPVPYAYNYIMGVIEFGAIADISIVFGNRIFDDDDPGFGRVCFGAGLGGGVEFGLGGGGVGGEGDFDDPTQAQCSSIQVDTDIAVAV